MGEDTLRISGGVNDAIAVYFADAALANVFLARWYTGQKAASADGLFRLRESGPTERVPRLDHTFPIFTVTLVDRRVRHPFGDATCARRCSQSSDTRRTRAHSGVKLGS